MSVKAVFLDCVRLKGRPVIRVGFGYDPEIIKKIKTVKGAHWSPGDRKWIVPESEGTLELLQELFSDYGTEITGKRHMKPLSEAQEQQIESSLERLRRFMRSKRYGENTIHTYTESVRILLRFLDRCAPETITNDDLIRFNNDYILKRGLSQAFQNQVVNGLKLFLKVVDNRTIEISEIHRPRREKRLPDVLSKEEVKQILSALTNLKHKLMLSLIYSCGLRCNELLQLKPEDIDHNRMIIHIRQSKGKKDRIVPLSTKIKEMLEDYLRQYQSREWLFEGQEPGNLYSARSLQQVMKQALQRAGIKKPATLHWLRHSFATHHHESGTDIRFIQELLGHKSSKTTEIYTHVSQRSLQNLRSPFDTL